MHVSRFSSSTSQAKAQPIERANMRRYSGAEGVCAPLLQLSRKLLSTRLGFPSPKQLRAQGINVLPPEGRRGLQAAKTGNASSAAPAKIDRSIFIGACTDQRPESLRLLTIPSSRSLHGAAHAGNYQGRPKALGPPRAPSPSHPIPQVDGAARASLCFVAGLGRGSTGIEPGH